MTAIHPTASVSPDAILGADVEIGACTIIHPGVTIGDRTTIGAYCELGIPTPLGNGTSLTIGADSTIRSHAVFYASSQFGERLVTGHHAIVRENTVAGRNLQIGTFCEIQGDCSFGDHVRMQSGVFVAKLTKIGDFVWLLPHAVLTNDPTPPSDDWQGCIIEDYATVSAHATVLPGVRVGTHALVAAHACVTKDVPPHMLVAGVPATIHGRTDRIKRRNAENAPAYPWPMHFHRGYPESTVAGWRKDYPAPQTPADND